MDAILNLLQSWDLHPVVDHFTVALLAIGVLIDLIASLAPQRAWIRYMALTLMILGAASAGSSFGTGDLEADRVGSMLSQQVHNVLHRHAEFGEYMAIIFGVLAAWRILIEGVGFVAGSRPLYLLLAVLSVGALLYTASLGGQLVYTYGVGTALLAATPASPKPAATPSLPNVALPTVAVPTPTPAATAVPTQGPKPATSPAPAADPLPATRPGGG